MAAKKGLSKVFTREVISEGSLAPSGFKVVPVRLSRSYADSPIEEIIKQKQIESSFAEERAAEERLRKARIPTEDVLDREKISRVVERINMLKKMQAEKAKQEASANAASAQNEKTVATPASADSTDKQENSPQPSKGSFIQKLNIFKKAQAEKPEEQETAKPQDTGNAPKQNSPENAQDSPKKETPAKNQENSPPANNSKEKKPDSLAKNKKDDSLKEPSF